MKLTRKYSPGFLAFTLIELLVVIAIIAILASMLLPAIGRAKVAAKENASRTEMNSFVAAVNQYKADYGRMPATQLAASSAAPDFTFCGTNSAGQYVTNYANPSAPFAGTATPYQAANAQLIWILMNYTNQVSVRLTDTNANFQGVLNPRANSYFHARVVGGTTQPGVGDDGVWRDAFGNPYAVTLDLNYDEHCVDSFYASLTGSPYTNVSAEVMVWSPGRNLKFTTMGTAYDKELDKHFLKSW